VQRTRMLLSAGAFAAATMTAVVFASSAGAWDNETTTTYKHTTPTTHAPPRVTTTTPPTTEAPTTPTTEAPTTVPTGGGNETTSTVAPTGGGVTPAVPVVATPKLTG
jgi:hypothetical protein